MIDVEKEKKYLFEHLSYYIDSCFDNVLTDSETDPEYSAVTACNLLKCYIDVMKYYGFKCPYENLESYFDYHGLGKVELLKFNQSRKKETNYYVGTIFHFD